jgi:hypothetical protein
VDASPFAAERFFQTPESEPGGVKT